VAELPVQLQAAKECRGLSGRNLRNASTATLLRCIIAKAVDATWKSTSQAARDLDVTEHLAEIQEEAVVHQRRQLKDEMLGVRLVDSAMTEQFFADHAAFGKGARYPRIFLLGDWPAACNRGTGYRHSFENWMHDFLKQPGQLAVVHDVTAADFVYIPFCAYQMLYYETWRQELEGHSLKYLPYQGLLVEAAIDTVERQYLIPTVQRLAQSTAFQHCMGRRSCRFLFALINGRHTWRRLSGFFRRKAIFVTPAAMSNWTALTRAPQQQSESFPPRTESEGERVKMGRRVSSSSASSSYSSSFSSSAFSPTSPSSCRAACDLHCQLTPPALLPGHDIAVPWTVAHRWVRRSDDLASRDILIFFSGTMNSCSRSKLMAVFRQSFMEATRALSAKGVVSADHGFLIFPQGIGMEQREWSELAFRAKFCAVPDGDSPHTGRLAEVIMHGCIPVIISNRIQPPFHEHVQWRDFAVFVSEDEIDLLPTILEGCGSGRRQNAQDACEAAGGGAAPSLRAGASSAADPFAMESSCGVVRNLTPPVIIFLLPDSR